MACLISLPHEMLHNIFVKVDPADLATLSSICRAFHDFIRKNRCLFKELYLKTFVGISAMPLVLDLQRIG